MKEESIHKPTPIERIEQFKKLFSDNPINWTNYDELANDCWLFLTNDKLPEKATIKKKSFLHEVKIMIESAVLFAGRSKSIESEKAKDERIKELEECLDKIINPIKYMQIDAEKEGANLDGQMAICLSKDSSYLQSIANKYLNTKFHG